MFKLVIYDIFSDIDKDRNLVYVLIGYRVLKHHNNNFI